jgi:hypothetical protein
MNVGLHVMYPLFLSDFNQNWISRYILEKYPNVKFHENPSSGRRNVPCGKMEGRTEGRMDIMALTAAFRILIGTNRRFSQFC